MRYVKRLVQPIFDVNLEDWEKAILESMNLQLFFVCRQDKNIIKEILCYMSDDSLFTFFNNEYKKAYNMSELQKEDIKKIIQSIQVGNTCIFDDDEKFIIIEDKQIIEKINSKKVKQKPYESWFWNRYSDEWHAPQHHPLQYQGKFVFIKSLDKVVENPNYDKYIWNENSLQWEKAFETDDLVYLQDHYMWELSSVFYAS